MKKDNYETRLWRWRRIKRIERRAKKMKYAGPSKDPRVEKIVAPAEIDLYNPENYNAFCCFLRDVKKNLFSNRKVFVCFRNTKKITAAAGLVLLAEFDKLVGRHGKNRVSATYPAPVRDKFGNEKRTVESVFNRIGLFKIIGKKERSIPEPPDVKCWHHLTGTTADGEAAGRMLSFVNDIIPKTLKKDLYRGSIEALSNCVEHAYLELDKYNFQSRDKRWWMFASVTGNRLTLLVCDLGVGIPNTIYKTQEKSLIANLLNKFGIKGTKESELIKIATHVKETRTKKKNRGWGGQDIRSPIRDGRQATLSIFSNRGRYRCTNRLRNSGEMVPTESIYDNRYSVGGTVVEWTVTL